MNIANAKSNLVSFSKYYAVKTANVLAPSNLASIGRYFLTPDIFDILRKQLPGSGGEIQLADAINTQANAGKVEAVPLCGQRFDCGSVDGYFDAIFHMAQNRKMEHNV